MNKTILVVGGAYQNKLEYAIEKFNIDNNDVADGEINSLEECLIKRVINNFHLLVKKELDNSTGNSLTQKIKGHIIIADEIGCGIVPIDKEDRTFRESYGRLLCDIAKISDIVVRVQCSIGQIIKGEIF